MSGSIVALPAEGGGACLRLTLPAATRGAR
jgi:hypothetical protein